MLIEFLRNLEKSLHTAYVLFFNILFLYLSHLGIICTISPMTHIRFATGLINDIYSLYFGSISLIQENICVISTGKLTGKQALEHKSPDRLPLTEKIQKQNSNISAIEQQVWLNSSKLQPKEYSYLFKWNKKRGRFLRGREEFPHNPSHRIRFANTSKHCSWINQLEILFGIVNCKLY